MSSIILATFLVALGLLLITNLRQSKLIYLVYFSLLLATPWLIILIIGRPSLTPPTSNKLVCNQASSNASCLTSLEFLFFQTDSRYHYGIKDYGVFLPSFIPAFLIGLWATINRSNKKHLSITLILITGLILTVLISKDSGFLSVLWSVVPISVLATLGFYKMLYGLMSKQSGLTVKTFVLLNFGLLVYETARFYQIIIFHKPFS